MQKLLEKHKDFLSLKIEKNAKKEIISEKFSISEIDSSDFKDLIKELYNFFYADKLTLINLINEEKRAKEISDFRVKLINGGFTDSEIDKMVQKTFSNIEVSARVNEKFLYKSLKKYAGIKRKIIAEKEKFLVYGGSTKSDSELKSEIKILNAELEKIETQSANMVKVK